MIWNNWCRVVIFDLIVKNQDTTPSTFDTQHVLAGQ
jgi:hypothetical protein